MTFKFKPAKREGVHLILGLMGGTGSGKTYSALELASGMAGDKRFAVIDTEAGRAKTYADDFDFDHGDLAPPFRPSAYLEAIVAAEKAGYGVIVVDSMSHEHAGEGGILDMHEAELDRIAGNDWKKRERSKFLAWVKPKMEHKSMLARLLQLRAHLILCFRAEPKMKLVKVERKGREVTEPVDIGWQPVCAKGLEFEMTASWMLRHERPGQFIPNQGDVKDDDPVGAAIKLPAPLRNVFDGLQTFNRQHGAAIARWAAGSDSAESANEAEVAPPENDNAAQKAEAALREAGLLDTFVEKIQMPPSEWGDVQIREARRTWKDWRQTEIQKEGEDDG